MYMWMFKTANVIIEIVIDLMIQNSFQIWFGAVNHSWKKWKKFQI